MGNYPKIHEIRDADVQERIEKGVVQSYPCLFYSHLHVRQVIEGIQILMSKGLSTIERIYKPNGKFPLLADESNESDEMLKFNLSLVVSNLLSEYHAFIAENGLNSLFLGKYLFPHRAFAYFVDLEEWHAEPYRPKMYECVLVDSEQSHPKFAVYFGQPEIMRTRGDLVVNINGKYFKTKNPFHKDVRELISERPLQEWVLYDPLRRDGETYNAAYDYLRIERRTGANNGL